MFTLNETQLNLLASVRAWQEEGERRFEFWSRREAQAAASAAFADVLTGSGFVGGRPLNPENRLALLRAAAELAPNGNLSRRLFSADPKAFDDRLRRLLFGAEPLFERVSAFLAQHGTGTQTASGLLCAFDPETYPLLTRSALKRLGLTPEQKRNALEDAAGLYGFNLPESGPTSAAQQMLALFVVYEQLRDILGAKIYPEVDDALRSPAPLLSPLSLRDVQVREPKAAYASVPPPALTETRLLAGLEDYAIGLGFTFPAYRLRSYYVALKTKPFAILSGVSGTGKTRLAELFAEAMTGLAPKQFRLIPVRSDWNDASALFGYQNVLANRYVSTPFLDIVRAAGLPENRRKTFFVCLDEMNLARVEHYLADYLSALESRAHRVPLHEGVADLTLPLNVFVTGTVNVDETTHGFSRKVLDRANTLDFDETPALLLTPVTSKGRVSLDEDTATAAQRQALFLASRVASVGKARERLALIAPTFPDRALAALQAANDLLYAHRLHFAYRVRDDVLMFLANSFDAETNAGLLTPDPQENFLLGLDLQVLQKVLPKLHGQSDTLTPLLVRLEAWASDGGLTFTAAKLARMRAHGIETGYIRFYE